MVASLNVSQQTENGHPACAALKNSLCNLLESVVMRDTVVGVALPRIGRSARLDLWL
jgi:hypothetical protein